MKKLLAFSVFLGLVSSNLCFADTITLFTCTYETGSYSSRIKQCDNKPTCEMPEISVKACKEKNGVPSLEINEIMPPSTPVETPEIVYSNTVTFPNHDNNEGVAIFEVSPNAYGEEITPQVAGTETEKEPEIKSDVEDKKIVLLKQQISILKQIIELLMARLATMKV